MLLLSDNKWSHIAPMLLIYSCGLIRPVWLTRPYVIVKNYLFLSATTVRSLIGQSDFEQLLYLLNDNQKGNEAKAHIVKECSIVYALFNHAVQGGGKLSNIREAQIGKKTLICQEIKTMAPHSGNTILFRSFQQLPHLGLQKGFFSWHVLLEL